MPTDRPVPATGPVDVPVPPAGGPDVVAACARLLAAVPGSLDGPDGPLARRPVSGDAQRTAAWGDPAVTLECGVPAGALTAEVLQLGPPGGPRVTFESDDVGPATAFTTGGRPAVRITVPDAYDATLLLDLVPLLPGGTAASASPRPS